jgi:acyl-CoA reductase-like NAD-dependent aldehyde dehydrogenase
MAESLVPQDFAGKIYLNGKYGPSSSQANFSLKNPKDGSIVVEGVPICNAEDVESAVIVAEEAFKGPWSKFTGQQRGQCLQKLVALLETRLMPALILDSYTGGNPVSLMQTREWLYIKNCILYYSGWTDKLKGDYFPADDGTSSHSL